MVRQYLLSFVFFLLTIAFCLPQAEAQILGKLKRTLEDKMEKKLEEEVDKELSKEVDKDLNQDTTLREDTSFGGLDRTNQALLEGLKGSKWNVEDVELPEVYDFKMRVTYEIQTEDKDPTTMRYLLPKSESSIMGFEMLDEEGAIETKMVWDLEREVIVMYQEDKKGNRSLQKLPNFADMFTAKMQQKQEEEQGETTITKTGKTETILGYRSEEYLIENEETTSHVWIAHDFPYSYRDFAALMQQQMKTPGFHQLSDKDGFALKIETKENKKRGDTTTMTATEVDEDQYSIFNFEYEGFE